MTHEEKLKKNNEWRRAHRDRVNEWNRQWREQNKGYWKEYRRKKKEERMKKQEELAEETVAAEAAVEVAVEETAEAAVGRTVLYAVEVGGRWYECVGGREGCEGCAFFAAGAGLCAAEGAGEMDAVRSVCGALGGQWAAMGEE